MAVAERGLAGGEGREEKRTRARGAASPTNGGGSHRREPKGEPLVIFLPLFFSVNLATQGRTEEPTATSESARRKRDMLEPRWRPVQVALLTLQHFSTSMHCLYVTDHAGVTDRTACPPVCLPANARSYNALAPHIYPLSVFTSLILLFSLSFSLFVFLYRSSLLVCLLRPLSHFFSLTSRVLATFRAALYTDMSDSHVPTALQHCIVHCCIRNWSTSFNTFHQTRAFIRISARLPLYF